MIPFKPIHPVFQDGRLYAQVKDVDYWPWEAIQPDQWRMADRITGHVFVHDRSMQRLQTTADILGLDMIRINSGHRGKELNEKVGGRPRSAHRCIAFDVPIDQVPDPRDLLDAAVYAGFTSFGCYENFIHMDMRWGNNGSPTRFWYGSGDAEKNWRALGVTGKSYVTLLRPD